MGVPFRNTILGYCNNDNFSRQQEIKLINQRHEQRKQQELINNVHLMTKMTEDKRRKSYDCDVKQSEETNITMNDLLNGRKPQKNVKFVEHHQRNQSQSEYLNDLYNVRSDVLVDGDSDNDSDEITIDKLYIRESLKKNANYSRNMNKHRESIQNVFMRRRYRLRMKRIINLYRRCRQLVWARDYQCRKLHF